MDDPKLVKYSPGMLHCILDPENNEKHIYDDSYIGKRILKKPAALMFYKHPEQEELVLELIAEKGFLIQFSGKIVKEEYGFMTFLVDGHKLILEENIDYAESAVLAKIDFITRWKIEQEENQLKEKMFNSIVKELEKQGVPYDPQDVKEQVEYSFNHCFHGGDDDDEYYDDDEDYDDE